MKARLTARARRDLDDIENRIAAFGATTSARIVATIEAAIHRAARDPASGRLQTVVGVRRLVTRRYGYIIYYRFSEGKPGIDVLTIHHGRQERPYADR